MNTSTSKMARHAWDVHKIDLKSHGTPAIRVASQLNNARIDRTPAISVASQLTNARTDKKPLYGLGIQENIKLFFIRWVVCMRIPSSIVENSHFRSFLRIFNSSLMASIPISNEKLRTWIVAEFHRRKQLVKAELQTSRSNINLSFDVLTSANYVAYLAVVCHFIDDKYQNQTLLLGFQRVLGADSGANQAEKILSIIQEYEITSKLGYFVLNNITSNDTCVDQILRELRPDLNIKERRLQCIGNIVNLTAKAFLFGKDVEGFQMEAVVARNARLEQRELEIWRQKGSIGKLHNLIKYICYTPQRREKFQDICDEDGSGQKLQDLMVICDNATQWNSACAMIERALELRSYISLFCEEYGQLSQNTHERENSCHLDILSREDWQFLSDCHLILKPFQNLAKRMEDHAKKGTHGSLWEVFVAIESTLKEMTKYKENYTQLIDEGQDTRFILASINNSLVVLERYRGYMRDSPAYFAAVITNPSLKLELFKQKAPSILYTAQRSVQTLWTKEYIEFTVNIDVTAYTPRREPGISTESSGLNLSDFEQWITLPDSLPELPQSDSYMQYLSRPRVPPTHCRDLLGWWKDNEISEGQVTKLALDMLSIPAMSAEYERTFSSAEVIINPHLDDLPDKEVDASECLRAWFLRNVGDSF